MSIPAVPSEGQALAAVYGVMSAMVPLPGTVLHYEQYLDDEDELIEKYQDKQSGKAEIWLMTVSDGPEIEGAAVGERYCQHDIMLRMLYVQEANDPQWSRNALNECRRVRDELNGNPLVFAIGGQRQLKTGETATLVSLVRKTTEKGNQIYEGKIALTVEGRRWA